jgi:L-glyceraldehyde 3-phosphate reductase
MMALDFAVRSGRALYTGISNYSADQTLEAVTILRRLGTPCLIHQPVYNMFNRWIEPDLLNVVGDEGIGCIPFSPLAQGLLTNRYLGGIAEGSRASKPHGFLKANQITDDKLGKIRKLNDHAQKRGQTLAQMALAWVLRDPRITTVLIGASSVQQIDDCVRCQNNLAFTQEELVDIDKILMD